MAKIPRSNLGESMVNTSAGGAPSVPQFARANFPDVAYPNPDLTRTAAVMDTGADKLMTSLKAYSDKLHDQDMRVALVNEEAKYLDEYRQTMYDLSSIHDEPAIPKVGADGKETGGVYNTAKDKLAELNSKYTSKFTGEYGVAWEKSIQAHTNAALNQAAEWQAKERELHLVKSVDENTRAQAEGIVVAGGDRDAVAIAATNFMDRLNTVLADRPDLRNIKLAEGRNLLAKTSVHAALNSKNPYEAEENLALFKPYISAEETMALQKQIDAGKVEYLVTGVRKATQGMSALNLEQQLAVVDKQLGGNPDPIMNLAHKTARDEVTANYHAAKALQDKGYADLGKKFMGRILDYHMNVESDTAGTLVSDIYKSGLPDKMKMEYIDDIKRHTDAAAKARYDATKKEQDVNDANVTLERHRGTITTEGQIVQLRLQGKIDDKQALEQTTKLLDDQKSGLGEAKRREVLNLKAQGIIKEGDEKSEYAAVQRLDDETKAYKDRNGKYMTPPELHQVVLQLQKEMTINGIFWNDHRRGLDMYPVGGNIYVQPNKKGSSTVDWFERHPDGSFVSIGESQQ